MTHVSSLSILDPSYSLFDQRVFSVPFEQRPNIADISVQRYILSNGLFYIYFFFVISGLTNTVTAVKNAQMAESPVLLLGGAAATLLKVCTLFEMITLDFSLV